jgi:tRNA G26 N,N-dimethylase Trm1
MTSTTIQADKLVKEDSLTLRGYDSSSSSSGDQEDRSPSPPHGRHVTTETIGNVNVELWQDLSVGCGGKTWEAASVMINYMVWKQQQDQSGSFLNNKKILDLGSGTGLVGIAVAKACPSLAHMELTDQIPMLSLMQDNIKLNHLESKLHASILNW